MQEIWKDVKGYEGIYQVSNMGNVKSLERTAKCPYGKRTVRELILNPFDNGTGFMSVRLYKKSQSKAYYVHRLVAEAFIENPFNQKRVIHIDRNVENNRADNLKWKDTK